MRFIFILSFLSVFAQLGLHTPKENTANAKVLLWEKDKRLTWDDFKGTPKSGSPFSAECNWEINYSYYYNPNKNKKLEFEVNCYFNSSKSWVRPKDKTKGLLEHEQVHFDIAELCSRQLRKNLLEAEFNKATFKDEINVTFKNTLKACDSIQVAYDEQTNHGLIKSKQALWVTKVQNEVDKLQEFEHNHHSLDNPFQDENLLTRIFSMFNIFREKKST